MNPGTTWRSHERSGVAAMTTQSRPIPSAAP